MKLLLSTTRFVLALLLLAAALPPAHAAPTPVVFLHTNDLHGQIYPLRTGEGDAGGFPAIAAIYLSERARALATGARVIVTNGGDVFQGTPTGDLTKGSAVLPLFAKLGHDAATLGNHDYDIGEAELAKRIPLFGCPLVCANLVRKGSLRVPSYLKRTHLADFGGLKVGFTGLMAEDLHEVTGREGVKNLDVLKAEKVLPSALAQLRAQGAELLVVLSHCGFERDLEIAKAVPGIDLILGAHTHTPVETPSLVGRTLVAQAGGNSRFVQRLELSVDERARRVVRARGTLIPVRPARGVNLAMAEAVERAAGPILSPLLPVLGAARTTLVHVSGPINTPEKRRELDETIRTRPDGIRAFAPPGADRPLILETNLAQFVCDAFRAAAKVDLAVTNITGIRAEIPAGEIRRLEVYNALPFDNTLVTMTLRGEHVRALFAPREGALPDRFLQLSGGSVAYRLDPATGRAELSSLKIAGREVDPAAAYTVATNSFLAQGGDGFEAFLKGTAVTDTKIMLRDAVMERVAALSPLDVAIEPRVEVLAAGAPSAR